MTGTLVPMADIKIGEHVERHFLGLTFNMDTIWTTLIAGTIVVLLGFWARSALTKRPDDHVPTKIQLVWEAIVKEVQTQVEDNLGRVHPFVVPLAVALFFFILIANWLELIPSELNHETHLLPAPTSDTNLTYAMALLVIAGVWKYGIQQQGFVPYMKHFYGQSIFPDKPLVNRLIRIVFTFLNVLEELIKPVTLALRLFGNIFAGGIMLALIASLITWKAGGIPVGGVMGIVFNIIWKLFDMFIGAVQAFIFALLTVLYFGMAGAGHGDEHSDERETEPDEHPAEPVNEPQSELVA
jgi:F-type H+-transporting ATPase subunit a